VRSTRSSAETASHAAEETEAVVRERPTLVDDLRAAVSGEVRFSAGDRALYSTDSSSYRQLPIGVVIPKTVDDLVAAVEVCRRHDVPVLPRGGGTSLAGQCCNVAVVMDVSKHLNGILELDRERLLARVQPGLILDHLRDRGEADSPRVTFGPTPSTHDHCTIGGMVGNNSCGNYSIMSEFYGAGPRMAHNVAELEVLTYDGLRMRVGKTTEEEIDRIAAAGGRRGEIYAALRDLRDRYAGLIRERFPSFPRRVSGFNLDGLLPENGFDLAYALTGSEGTCVTFLEATLHLVDSPPARSLVVVGFEDLYAAAAQIVAAREHRPLALEGFDEVLIQDNISLGIHEDELRLLPDGRGWLMAEFGGRDKAESDEKGRAFMDDMRRRPGHRAGRLYDDPAAERKLWQVRESGLGATAYVPGKADTFEGWEDSAVPPEHLAPYLRDLRALMDRYGYACSLYGHFGQGCVHTRIDWDPHTEHGIRTWRGFLDEASDLVLSYGGSLSGEHGDGQSRAELLPKMYGEEIVRAFREFKAIWDPAGRMNPGKVVDPNPIVSNLRFGTDYAPAAVVTHFSYPRDAGNFAHAAARCVGVGTCRRTAGGTMCPSFMATREEKHSTRGRARLLFEMMRGDEIELWKSTEVLGALDLCLSCKGCKSECPVNVDMATYKAEFLSHHYRGRVRPKAAYALGLIHRWARLASRTPRLVNAVTHTPLLASLLKRAAGVAPQREAPRFAHQTFRSWFEARPVRGEGRPQVLLWPDTFTNFLRPEAGKAHVEVLEAAGFQVVLPERVLCCGRPLYDYGMLDTAERLLRKTIETLRAHIRAGTPVVGMEPSCVAVFRDELTDLLPDDLDAERLAKQTLMLSEFLSERVPSWVPPTLERRALVQRHCHHGAVMGFDAEEKLLRRMGLDLSFPNPGCCGLAGSFGFEAGRKYDVSMAVGEQALLPALRDAPEDILVVADGFSCRTQIEHGTGRTAMHFAEVVRLAQGAAVGS
jgi:FAD/FMN-containing dehydrogenase/Fe-S oxidoreductase